MMDTYGVEVQAASRRAQQRRNHQSGQSVGR